MKALLFLAKTTAHVSAFLLAFVCAAASMAAQGGRFSDRLDALTHFAPFWLVGGLAAGALWLIFVRREGGFFTVVLAAVAVLSSATLMAPELVAADRGGKAVAARATIKIIQFNLWADNADPEATAAWIIAQKPDVVVAEEAMPGPGGVQKRLAAHFKQQTSCAEPDPICPTMIFYDAKAVAEGGVLRGADDPYLAAAWATIPSRAGPFTVVGAHYTWPWPAGPQQAQGRRLAALLKRFDKDSLIVAGDFNSTPWSFTLRRQDKAFGLERRTRALASWPTDRATDAGLSWPFPVLPIDHVYAGKAWRTVSVKRGPRLGSDHYPVVVVLERTPR